MFGMTAGDLGALRRTETFGGSLHLLLTQPSLNLCCGSSSCLMGNKAPLMMREEHWEAAENWVDVPWKREGVGPLCPEFQTDILMFLLN